MADRIIKVLTPATNWDFLTLDEAKTMLGLTTTFTPEEDAQMQFWITNISMAIGVHCNNRPFAYEEMRETWRSDLTLSSNRIFLSHWPVKESDVEIVEVPRGTVVDPSNYEVEEGSGKIELLSGVTEPIQVTYSGGYKLPDDAPGPLKHAAAVLVRNERIRSMQAQTAGIRSISHRDARVMFFDPNTIIAKTMGVAGQGMDSTVAALLTHYTRLEC